MLPFSQNRLSGLFLAVSFYRNVQPAFFARPANFC